MSQFYKDTLTFLVCKTLPLAAKQPSLLKGGQLANFLFNEPNWWISWEEVGENYFKENKLKCWQKKKRDLYVRMRSLKLKVQKGDILNWKYEC